METIETYPNNRTAHQLRVYKSGDAQCSCQGWTLTGLTFPPKTTPLARKLDCAVMGRKEEAHDSKTAYGGADHRRVKGGPGWGQCSGPVPEARHLGCHLL